MSNVHTPTDQVLIKSAFINAITAASNNGAGVDTLGFETALCVFDSAPSGTGTTSDCKLQDSADNSTFADVTNATFAQVTTAGGHQIQGMNVRLFKRRRYIRLVHTGAGGSAAGQAEGSILLFNDRYKAPTQDNAVVSV